MSSSLKPIRKGAFCQIPHQDGTSSWVVLVSHKGVEYRLGKYATQAEAVTAYQNHLLSRVLQLFDPLTADQKQYLQTAAREYPAVASFLGRLSMAWQPIHYPKKRANKSSARQKEDFR